MLRELVAQPHCIHVKVQKIFFIIIAIARNATSYTVIWLVPGKVMLHNDFQITG